MKIGTATPQTNCKNLQATDRKSERLPFSQGLFLFLCYFLFCHFLLRSSLFLHHFLLRCSFLLRDFFFGCHLLIPPFLKNALELNNHNSYNFLKVYFIFFHRSIKTIKFFLFFKLSSASLIFFKTKITAHQNKKQSE